MNDEGLKILLLATACEVQNESAYVMLQNSYIEDFLAYYRDVLASNEVEEKPTMLDALINFTIIQLPILTSVSQSIRFDLRSRRSRIVHRFLTEDISSLITTLASLPEVRAMVKRHLLRENNHVSMYAKINDSRVSSVISDFLEVFRVNCAHAYRFDGSFQEFVMHSFIQFYYKGRKKDIWAMLREVDDARRDLEQSIVTERVFPIRQSDDLKIHDLLVNISVVNDLMFKHPGQSDGARGLQYDVYYLILWKLCEERVAHINEQLGYEALILVDPYDRKNMCLGLLANKGIYAKVRNAKELVPYIFEYVRNGKLNIAGISDLRDRCFLLGRHDREGRNCIWKDVQVGGETSYYLDTPEGRQNYNSFDQVVKGVISVYALMTGLERRGYYLVDEYRQDLFQDKNLIRYIDYYSAVPWIDLIHELQEEVADSNEYCDSLVPFDAMLSKYAGSDVNNHANIRENRYYNITYGFLNNPRIKQTGIPTTRFEKLQALASAFCALPHGYIEFVLSLHANDIEPYLSSNWTTLPVSNFIFGKYIKLYFNQYLRQQPQLAEYYLKGNDNYINAGFGLTPSISWSVSDAEYNGIVMMESQSVWLPIDEKFYFYAMPPETGVKPFIATWSEIELVTNESRVNGVAQNVPMWTYGPLSQAGAITKWMSLLKSSVSFPTNVGFKNLRAKDICSVIDKFKVFGKHRQYVKVYYDWLDDNARLQHSFIDILSTMQCQSLWWVTEGIEAGVRPAQAEVLLRGLSTGVFGEEALNWFLTLIHDRTRLNTISRNTAGNIVYTPLDRTILSYCFREVEMDTPGAYAECVEISQQYDSPAARFVAIFNHVYVKLEFLFLLRDSFSLLLSTAPRSTPTLVCELNSRFKVMSTLSDYTHSTITEGLRLKSTQTFEARSEILRIREKVMSAFFKLLEDFYGYVRDCEGSVANLINYNVSAHTDIASRFSNWEKVFTLLPPFTDVPELDTLRRVAITDSAGFFLYGGKYFCGSGNNSIAYYVHRSGYMLAERNGKISNTQFRPDDMETRSLYRAILQGGFRNAGK